MHFDLKENEVKGMKKNCEVCGKSIGFLGGLIAKKVGEKYVCADCSGKINEIVNLYGKSINNYTFEQMRKIAKMIDIDTKNNDTKFSELFVMIISIENSYNKAIKEFKQMTKDNKKEILKSQIDSAKLQRQCEKDYREFCEIAKRHGDYSHLKEDKKRLEADTEFLVGLNDLDIKRYNIYIHTEEIEIERLEAVKKSLVFEYRMLDMIKEVDLFGFTGTTDNLLESDLAIVEAGIKKYMSDSGNVNQNFAKTSYANWRLAALVHRLYHIHNLYDLEGRINLGKESIEITNTMVEMEERRLVEHQNDKHQHSNPQFILEIKESLEEYQKRLDDETQEYLSYKEEYDNGFQLYREALSRFIHFDEKGVFIDDIDQNEELQELFKRYFEEDEYDNSQNCNAAEKTLIKTERYSVKLIAYNTSFIKAVKIYRNLTSAELKDATEKIRSSPCTLFDNLDKQTAISYIAEFKTNCPDIEIVIEQG